MVRSMETWTGRRKRLFEFPSVRCRTCPEVAQPCSHLSGNPAIEPKSPQPRTIGCAQFGGCQPISRALRVRNHPTTTRTVSTFQMALHPGRFGSARGFFGVCLHPWSGEARKHELGGGVKRGVKGGEVLGPRKLGPRKKVMPFGQLGF